jgi:diguanylate cyclase (GGDEF)-like protein/PAS domain S-box-containing protein
VLAVAVPVATATLLISGFVPFKYELMACTVLAAVSGAWYGIRLIRLAVRVQKCTGGVGTCRTAGLLGVGLLAGAAAFAAVAGLAAARASEISMAYVAAGGLGAATTLFLPTLLLLPGAASDPIARLRRGLDGVSLGICLLFTAWVLVIAPNGRIVSLGFWVALLTCCTLSIAAVAALRARRRWRSAVTCAAAVCLAVGGVAVLSLGLANTTTSDGSPAWPIVSSAMVAAAPILAWMGAWRAVTEPEEAQPAEAAAAGTFAGFPLLALPVAAAIAVFVYRLVGQGRFDRASIALGLAGIAALTLRETLAALDVTRHARHITTREAHFRTLVAGSTDVTVVIDRDLVVRWQSPAAARQFGLSDQDVVGRPFLSLLHPEDVALVRDRLVGVLAARWHRDAIDPRPALVEARLRDGFGRWRDTESTISDQLDAPEVGGVVVHLRDVGERRELERTLHHLSFVDHLTGLANRRQMLLTMVALRAVPDARGAFLQFELDGFSSVNDVRGHDIGDAVLIEVARRLRAGTEETDLPARLGGDEFAVVTDVGAVQAYALASRLVTMLAEPITLPGATVHLTASVGLAELAGGKHVDDVLRRADLALHRAKQLGRGRVEWYDEALESDVLRRMTLEQDLPGVLGRGELDLVYQPVLDLADERPLGVEAFLRWRHPRLGTLLPADILPVAEDLGVTDAIGGWVLHQACRQLSVWLREGRDLWLAVNLSCGQLRQPDTVSTIACALDKHELPADRLVLEVSEAGLGTNCGEVADQLAGLRTLGTRTALDDFGAGSASLAILRRLPVDFLKIGKPFFAEPSARPNPTLPIIEVIVGLGRRLGVEIVAEGLEAASQLEIVRDAGCRFGQGHLFAQPQPAERVEAYLDGYRTRYQ